MKALLFDVTKCRGCRDCVAACAEANGSPGGGLERFVDGGPGAGRRSALVSVAPDRFVRQGCVHCLEPACESACLVGALHRAPGGEVRYDADRCIGCRYCMLACPFSVPRYEWEKTRPLVTKCELCHDRPGGPACAAACPHGAIALGSREALLRRAHERIRERPGLYVDHVWGEREAGGTAVLFLSDVPLDTQWPASLGPRSVVELTWPVVRTTPFLFGGVAACLAALSFVVHRRNRLAAERVGNAAPGGEDDAA